MQTVKEVKRVKRPSITEIQREEFDQEFTKQLGYEIGVTDSEDGVQACTKESTETHLERLVRERKEKLNVR